MNQERTAPNTGRSHHGMRELDTGALKHRAGIL
jgi:hypothetical protein